MEEALAIRLAIWWNGRHLLLGTAKPPTALLRRRKGSR